MKRGTRALTSLFGNKSLPKSKRSQMKLSFGMIFSIILIIIFLVFAFYVINEFLDIQESVEVGQFTKSLQSDVDNAWRGSQYSQEIEYVLPKKIEKVCFIDESQSKKGENSNIYDKLKGACYYNENMVFYPVGSAKGLESKEIKHLDIEGLTANPFCIENVKGKVKITIQKSFGEELVTIKNG